MELLLCPLAGLLVLVSLVLLSIDGIQQTFFRGRRDRLYRNQQCTRCGYDIRHNLDVRRCPECGEDLFAQAVSYWKDRLG